jgi:hypothetical protein
MLDTLSIPKEKYFLTRLDRTSNMDGMEPKNHSEIIALWPIPSVPTLARDLSAPKDRVYKWFQRKNIPSGEWQAIVEAARKRRIRVNLKMLASLVDA